MLKRENYTSEHIDALRKQTGADPSILERTGFAFGLLEALCRVKMPFIFKGGTSLLILLDEPRRLSTDTGEKRFPPLLWLICNNTEVVVNQPLPFLPSESLGEPFLQT